MMNRTELDEIQDVISMLGDCDCPQAIESAEKLFAILKPHLLKSMEQQDDAEDYKKEDNSK